VPGAVAGAEREMNEPAWEAARQQLIRLLREHAVHYGPPTVAPGVVTDVFIDPSRITLRGDGLALIEALLVPLLREDRVEAVGGPAMGAIPLVPLLARRSRGGAQRSVAFPAARHGSGAARRSRRHRDLPAALL
jgi:orotate phosphoribosyltransferase